MALKRFQQGLDSRLQQAQVGQQLQAEAFKRQQYNALLMRQREEAEREAQARAGQEYIGANIPELIARSGDDFEAYKKGYSELINQSPVPIPFNLFAQGMNAFKAGQPPAKKDEKAPTDLGNYVDWESQKWLKANPGKTEADVPPQIKQTAFLEAKRAQYDEVVRNTGGKVGTEETEKEAKKVYDSAKDAKKQIVKIDELINMTNNSKAITGFGAEFIRDIERIRAKLTGDEVAKLRARDTQYLDALMGSEVFAMIKALGVGARGLDTPAEREFMRQVITGELPMEKGTILKMAQFRKDAALRSIDEYNQFADAGAFNNLRLPRLEFGASDVTPQSSGSTYPEGTVIKNGAGARMVMRNGKWESM